MREKLFLSFKINWLYNYLILKYIKSTHDKNLGEKNKDIIIGITNISDNGKLLIKNDKNLFVDNVHYDEMFRYNENDNSNDQKNNDIER